MFDRACVRTGLLALTLVSVVSGFAQPAVVETLFNEKPGLGRSNTRSLYVNANASRALDHRPEHVKVKSIPLSNGGSAGFDMKTAKIFADGAAMTVVSASGSTHSVELPNVRAWYGQETGGGPRTAFMAERSDGSLGVMITGGADASDTVIMPNAGGADYGILATELPARDYCDVGDLLAPDSVEEDGHNHAHTLSTPETAALGSGTRQVEVMLDISYATYQRLGSDNNKVIDYVTQLMGSVSTIYRRDLDVQLVVSHFYVWTTPDPFNVDNNGNGVLDTGDQLNAYQKYLISNRSSVDRDLAHLVNYNRGLGGIAYVNVLCRDDYGLGVSNVYADLAFPSDINTYYWDTMVVAHEMGHNFGSTHTHCYSPPIDCCAVSPSCSDCATASPALSTIMSYCHTQTRNGGGIMMKFHERVVEVMRSKVEAATGCLAPYTAAPRLAVAGDTTVEIKHGDTTPELADSTDFGSVEAGAGLVTKKFILGNPGSEELQFTNAILVEGSRQFSITEQSPLVKLAPGQASYFAVTFDPAASGTHDARVIISTNDPVTPRFEFTIRATSASRAHQQVFNYTGNVAIPDGNAQGVTVNIPVSGVQGSTMDIDVAFNGTDCSDPNLVGLQHTFVGDLKITLESPTGVKVVLMDRPGPGDFGSGSNHFCGTILDSDANAPSIDSISPGGVGVLTSPHTGTLAPQESLSAFYGSDPNGTWKLHVSDLMSPGAGALRAVSLALTGSVSSGSADVADWSAY